MIIVTKHSFLIIVLMGLVAKGLCINAPVTTISSVVQTTGTTASVPVTVTDFTIINSFALEIHYDPTVAVIISAVMAPSVGGGYNTNLTTPGILRIGWYTWPGVTLSPNSLLMTLTFSRITDGTTAVTWFDDGYSCYYSDENYNILDDVPQSTFYIDGSVTFGTPLTSAFSADNLVPVLNATVNFSDNSTGGPTGWDWSFNRPCVTYVNGTNHNSQNPSVVFTEGGHYSVTLTIYKGSQASSETKTNYICAGTPGKWSGTASSEWNNQLNWENQQVPGAAADVTIPSSATWWPVYNGNLTLGTTVHSIIISNNGEITVTGNLTLNPGSSITFTGNGRLTVHGDWLNSGTFLPGAGTVEFTGITNTNIFISPAGVINTFNNVVISKSGSSFINHDNIFINGNLDITN